MLISDDDGKEILNGYLDEVTRLKSLVFMHGLNYRVTDEEYPLLYWFLEGSANTTVFPSNIPVFRARIVHKEDVEYIGKSEEFKGFCKDKCGAPPTILCRGQRVNSEYQRYLYCASSEYTALAETRPYLNQQISIAKFKLSRKVKLFDLIETNCYTSNAHESYSYILSTELSRPVADCDKKEDYCFTQYISNLIMLNGFDGIRYLSSLNSDGNNVVFFNPAIAEPLCSNLYTLRRLCFGAYNWEDRSVVQHALFDKADNQIKTEYIDFMKEVKE